MVEITYPKLLSLKTTGTPDQGYLAVLEESRDIPFEIKRVYWTFNVPSTVIRGQHAHRESQQVIFAIHGKIEVQIEHPVQHSQLFLLQDPQVGLYIPPKFWFTLRFHVDAALLSVSSHLYDEKDYIRDYSELSRITQQEKT